MGVVRSHASVSRLCIRAAGPYTRKRHALRRRAARSARRRDHARQGRWRVRATARMADVELVDYARPGFAVVWLEGEPSAASARELAIRANEFETRLEPRWLAVASRRHRCDLSTSTREPHTVSCPSLGIVRRLEPGDALELPRAATPAPTRCSCSTGRRSRAASSPPAGRSPCSARAGHFELRDVRPGAVRAARVAPASSAASNAGRRRRRPEHCELDLEMGVGRRRRRRRLEMTGRTRRARARSASLGAARPRARTRRTRATQELDTLYQTVEKLEKRIDDLESERRATGSRRRRRAPAGSWAERVRLLGQRGARLPAGGAPTTGSTTTARPTSTTRASSSTPTSRAT